MATDDFTSTDPSTDAPHRRDTDTLGAEDASALDNEYDDDAYDEEEYEEVEAGRWNLRGLLVNFGACGISMIFHLVALILLGLLTLPAQVENVKTMVSAVFEDRPEEEPVEIELEQQLQTASEQSVAVVSSSPAVGVASAVQGVAGAAPQLDQKIFTESAQSEMGEISIDAPLTGAPSFRKLVEAVPDGEFKGDPRAIIDDYAQAMDRIAQELMWMMDKGPVLVVWAFDESGSMKDDQKEIRDRINNVYVQLGLVGRTNSDLLLTSIVSYGENYRMLTKRPTSDIHEIRTAIDSVPEDKSGKEIMCQAVTRAIVDHREFAQRTRRTMALILVTDESGEQDDNDQFLERSIAEAKSAKSRIYILGREAVFGYPYAYMRWRHPQTNRPHWLRVNRGPESGFVEQLQIDGFRRRHDAFASGFGPYEQCRMARETGGIFFMLPSIESALVRGEKRRYQLDIMRPYRPDLRARAEVLTDRDKYPLRTTIWNCIYDLNPYRPEISKEIEMRVHFSRQFPEFVQQARLAQTRARNYLLYLARMQKVIESGTDLREREADPRWQANFDLISAQLIAYQARIWEYGAALEEFLQEPKVVPMTKSPNLHLVHWDITVRPTVRTEESKPYIERANELFQVVIDNHPGTPWAARAAQEMKRGYGVELVPDYDPPYVTPPGGVTIPIPKL